MQTDSPAELTDLRYMIFVAKPLWPLNDTVTSFYEIKIEFSRMSSDKSIDLERAMKIISRLLLKT